MRYFLICFKLQDPRSGATVSGHIVYKDELLDINNVIKKAKSRPNDIVIITSVFELTESEHDLYLSKFLEQPKANYPETEIP